MVQHAVAEDDVEAPGREDGSKQVHLHELHALQFALLAERLAEPQRVQAQIRADDLATADAEEVGQLAGAAADLENVAVVGNRLVQSPRVEPGPRLLDQGAHGVVVVVVGKGSLLVERLDDLGDVARVVEPLVRPEELRDVLGHLERVLAAPARQPAVLADECGTAAGAGQ